MPEKMHPRIRSRRIETLRAERARLQQDATQQITAFVTCLEQLRQMVTAINATGNLTVPASLTDLVSQAIDVLRRQGVDSDERLLIVELLGPKLVLLSDLLNISTRLQAVKQDIARLHCEAKPFSCSPPMPAEFQRTGTYASQPGI